jgi:hypothetical protein
VLEPDRDQIEIFVDALFRHAGTEGFVSMRAFFEDDGTKPFRINPTSLAGGLKFLIEVAEDDAGRAANHPKRVVFCPPLAVFANRDRAREQDILAGLALSVECDTRPLEAATKLEKLLGPPTLIVRSGGKWTDPATEQAYDKLHLHWRLRLPARGNDLAKLKQTRDLAARLVGGDPSNKPVCHPIRWAGSWHRKADPVLCHISEAKPDCEIDLDTALAALIAASPAPSEKPKGNGHDGAAGNTGEPTDWSGPVQGIISGSDYHNASVVLAAKFLAAGLSDGAAVNMLRALMESSTAPHDGRWAARYADIPRAVKTAREKIGEQGPNETRAAPAKTIAEALKNMQFEPIKYVVPGIIVEGLTLLAAKPKLGKSWLMLHAAIAVARGGFTLGEIHCPEGDALYLALEDNLRRLKSRMTMLLGSQQPWPRRLHFMCELPRLAEGGLAEIKGWIAASAHPRLIIIDTLAMVRAPKKKDQTQYDADYAAVVELRKLANEHDIAVVLVHHLRKQEADDAFDLVSGTLGLTGGVDTVLVLKRDTTGTIVLHGRGRDLVEIEKAMTFNRDACTWTISGEVAAVRTSSERKAILDAMKEIGAPATPTEIAAIARLKPVNVRRMILNMAKDGLVQKSEYGKYEIGTATATATASAAE